MGIGNWTIRRKAYPGGRRCVSLPLMGIGNWGISLARCIKRLPFVTHYPSWGLETTVGTSGETSSPPDSTHYPSWGLETVTLRVRYSMPRLLIDSLPLMGIGNARIGVKMIIGPTLITPSWGLETWVVTSIHCRE